jgi:hypothetical protein
LSEGKGVIVRAELDYPWLANVELVCAFGGVDGMKGRRNGDIGCEREPVGTMFQLKPEQCRGNQITIGSNSFTLAAKAATICGLASSGAEFNIADAADWNRAAAAMARRTSPTETPIVTGHIPLEVSAPAYLLLQPSATNQFAAADLPRLFAAAEERRRAIAERVVVETPDPFINAAAGALNIAADAVWDSQSQSFMHGAVAWRMRLLGWRGPYAGDALGWHERTAAHFTGYARNQNTNAIAEKLPPADEEFNLARNEAALHSHGDLMNRSHYDMNLVAVDTFFRHLLWTGDLDYARAMWPVIERHLAWERRLFRREFGDDKLPLYEAYAAIWASDDLNYNGAGTTHGSAYNYFANQTAARVAKLIGKDGALYEHEADLILRGMNKYLWLADEGNFAECKDLLGLQLVHPNSGLWTFYHTLDSEVPTATQAQQMARWIDDHIAHIPIQTSNRRGREESQTNSALGSPPSALENDLSLLTSSPTEASCYTLPETSWLPYQWSLNNVVVAEMMHTSLGFWQADRRDAAFPLFKGALLDTMFLGLCPGNVGAMTHYDMARGEAQRDFADGIGITARALVEGLFGVKPDALAGELKIVPGFPAEWTNASIKHPDFNFSFRRDGLKETFVVEQKFKKSMAVLLEVYALCEDIKSVTVNDQPVKAAWFDSSHAMLQIGSPAAARTEFVVVWKGNPHAKKVKSKPTKESPFKTMSAFDWMANHVSNSFESVNLASNFNDRVTQIFRNEYRSPRSPFVSLATPKQGIGGWCEPNEKFDVDDSGLRAVAAKSTGKIILPNGVPLATPGESNVKNIAFVSQWDNYPREISLPLAGKSSHAFLLMAGSTDAMKSRLDNGEVIVTYADGTTTRLALRNPETWWPIDQDYFTDDYAFRLAAPLPPRVDLKTGKIRVLDAATFKGTGGKVPGGAATVLELPLDGTKELKSLTVRALANEVVIGLMSVTLAR